MSVPITVQLNDEVIKLYRSLRDDVYILGCDEMKNHLDKIAILRLKQRELEKKSK